MRRLVALVVVVLALSSCARFSPIVTPKDPPLGSENMPSRTKAVHIFVVPEGIEKDIEKFAVERGATTNDIFIVGSQAMSFSYSERRLLPIIEAAGRDWEAIPFVDLGEREQLQWQSANEFELTGIEKINDPVVVQRPLFRKDPFRHNVPKNAPTPREPWQLDRNNAAPGNPFARLKDLPKERIPAAAATGSTQRSIRSGIADFQGAPDERGQLYRLSLAVKVGDERRAITPGIFVFACGTRTSLLGDNACRRRHVSPSDYPNRTKVVRLIPVDGTIADDSAALLQFVRDQSIAETDVLLVGGEPKSYLHNNGLTDHEEALIDDHPVVYVMVQELEQLQWESNADFRVSNIEKKAQKTRRFKEGDFNHFGRDNSAPGNPFLLFAMPKERSRQFLSGVASVSPYRGRHGQLYKVSFEMMLDGKLMLIDPDVYCDM
jgi:hypothetical protein